MNTRKLIQIIICLAVAVAILVPAITLFNWGDYLYCSFDAPANQKMMVEVLILAVIIGAASFLIKLRKGRLIVLSVLTIVFSYIHGMLLPVAVAGIYFLAVASIGNLVTGIATVIIAEGLLSLFGWGTPKKLGAVVLIIAILYTAYRILSKKDRIIIPGITHKDSSGNCFNGLLDPTCNTTKWQLLVNAVVLLVVLVQIGRATVAVRDFDSLWYGLRSNHVLAPGGDIFEDLGLVGMVYTYSKGYEILTLPLSAYKSYAYIPVFNTCLFIAGLSATYKLVNTMCSGDILPVSNQSGDDEGKEQRTDRGISMTAVMDRHRMPAYLAVIITAVIPGIVNMCVSAKPDIVTWMLQIIMLERFFSFVRCTEKSRCWTLFFEILAAYLLSLAMKPTAVIFSTALAAMMLIWWIIDLIVGKNKSAKKHEDKTTAIISAAAAMISLIIVFGRTIKLTGVPFTSVFSGLLTSLGFSLKYPFASGSIPTRFKGDSVVKLVGKRAFRMLLSPEGSDMGHVSIAWGGSIMLVLAVIIIIGVIVLIAAPRNKKIRSRIPCAAAIVFIPYAIICAVSLAMLSQVDGNYYMTLYSIVIISAMWLAYEAVCTRNQDADILAVKVPTAVVVAMTVMIACQFFIVLLTNWASAAGFTPIAFNRLYYDSRNDNRITMTAQASPEAIAAGDTIYDRLATEPQARVLAVAEHPFCLQYECVVESYGDLTNPWGNPELENSYEEFVDYLHFADVDYIYADMDYLSREECNWRRGLLEEMEAKGLLYDHFYEGNTYLARVR